MNRRAFLGLLALAASNAHADLYDDYMNSTSKEPFVAFLARKGAPGHAFVALGVRLNAGLKVYERFFGLYPDDTGKLASLKLVFGRTTGRLDYRWADTRWDVAFERSVSPEQMAQVKAQFARWSENTPTYALLGNGGKNCSMLVGDVARSIGMKVPDGAASSLPWDFVESLRNANL